MPKKKHMNGTSLKSQIELLKKQAFSRIEDIDQQMAVLSQEKRDLVDAFGVVEAPVKTVTVETVPSVRTAPRVVAKKSARGTRGLSAPQKFWASAKVGEIVTAKVVGERTGTEGSYPSVMLKDWLQHNFVKRVSVGRYRVLKVKAYA